MTGEVKFLRPRHLEIMHRLIAGQKQQDIAGDLGITGSRLSVIVRSPLFQLEMRKLLLKREEKVFNIQENFLKAAELGTAYHKDILSGTYPSDLKLKAATTMTILAAKLMGGKNGGVLQDEGNGGEGKSYEERLREVTFRETVRTVKGEEEVKKEPETPQELLDLLGNGFPTDEEFKEFEMDEDVIFGPVKDESEEDPFSMIPEKIENLVSTERLEGLGKENDRANSKEN